MHWTHASILEYLVISCWSSGLVPLRWCRWFHLVLVLVEEILGRGVGGMVGVLGRLVGGMVGVLGRLVVL